MLNDKSRSSRGVSSVVGVILMVALTVLLAALIAQFAFGIAGRTQEPVQAGVTIEQSQLDSDPSKYEVTVILTKKQDDVDRIEVKRESGPSPPAITEVGDFVSFEAEEGELITIVAISEENERVVIQKYNVG